MTIEVGSTWRHRFGDFVVTVINSEAKIEYRLENGEIKILGIDAFEANFEKAKDSANDQLSQV